MDYTGLRRHGISTIKYQKCRLGVLVSAFKHGLVPLPIHVLDFRYRSMRALRGFQVRTFKRARRPHFRRQQKSGTCRRHACSNFGSRYRLSGDGDTQKLDVSRRIARIAANVDTCSLTHIRGRNTGNWSISISNDKGRNAHSHLVIASRLCRDTGVIVIKQISTICFRG
jgi:hypothetical protein